MISEGGREGAVGEWRARGEERGREGGHFGGFEGGGEWDKS